MTSKRASLWRYMTVALVFCLICVIYLGRAFYIQISGRENRYDSGSTTRTGTIQAVRGEIYDRNGNALVTNRYTYDLVLSYGAFASLGTQQANETCLYLLQALRDTDSADKHVEKFFPFDGAYPYYSLSAEAADGDSIPYHRLQRVLSDVGLKMYATV